MPKLINAYSADNPLAESLSGLANSFFGNTPQLELYRQKAKGLARENENLPLVAGHISSGDYTSALAAAVNAGLDPKSLGGYGQYFNVNQYGPASKEATTATMAVPGANFGNTMQGTRESEANRVGIENLRTQRQFDVQRYAIDNTPQTYFDPTTSQPVIGRRSESFGRTPLLSKSDAEGMIVQKNLPGMTPQQQAQVGGYAPQSVTPYAYKTPDGREGTAFSLNGGMVDSQTNEKLPEGTKAIKLEGPNAEGLSGNSSVDQGILAARTATDQAVASIDRLVGELTKPDAGAAVGPLGKGAALFNDVRAQVEATARLFRGASSAQEFASPDVQSAVDSAVTRLFSDANFNARAQALGINAAIVRSQIQDLAYTIGKSQDPSGRLSKDDILRAAETIGGTLMDPVAGVQVLQDLKSRLIANHDIRERNTREMYPKLESKPRATAPAAAPTQRIRIDNDGNVIP
jgi:hypothetical protein